MQGDTRLLISAIVVGVFAFVMFSASGFFYSNLNEIMRVCSRYSYADCYSNESIRVSLASLKFGIGFFFATGSVAWVTATYICVKWTQTRSNAQLP
jgi:hypothetical protein